MYGLWRRRDFLKLGTTGLIGAAGLSALATPQPLQAADDKPGGFRFVHLTDIHVQPELEAERGFRQCIEAVNKLSPRPDFVITGGDLIMDALDVPYDRAENLWKIYEGACRDFETPVYDVIGNHDILGWSSKGVIKPDHMDYGKQMFADRVGKGRTYRSFDHCGWHFILLDSVALDTDGDGYQGLIDDAQLDWLKQDLAAVGRQRPIIIVTHIPFFSTWLYMVKGPQYVPERGALVTNAPALRKLFIDYNVRMVLQGHLHVRERIDYAHTSFIISGAVCGRWWKGIIDGLHPEGFGVIDVTATDAAWSYATYGWKAVAG